MKRIISFMMTIITVCGVLLTPLGSIEVRAENNHNYDSSSYSEYVWSDSYDICTIESNDHSGSTVTKYDVDMSSLDNIKMSNIIQTILNNLTGNYSEFIGNDPQPITKLFKSDTLDDLKVDSFSPLDGNDSIVSAYDVIVLGDADADNELYILGRAQCLDTDYEAITYTFGLCCSKGESVFVITDEDGFVDEAPLYSTLLALNHYDSDVAARGIGIATELSSSGSETHSNHCSSSELFNKMNDSDFINWSSNRIANDKRNISGFFDDCFDFEYVGPTTGGFSFNLKGVGEFEGDDINGLTALVATVNGDLVGTDVPDNSSIEPLVTLANTYCNVSGMDRATVAEQAEQITSDDFIWQFIKAYLQCTADTELPQQTDPDAKDATISPFNMFSAYQYALAASLEYGKDNTGYYNHTVTLTDASESKDTANQSYILTFSQGTTGTKLTVGTQGGAPSEFTSLQKDTLIATYTKLCNERSKNIKSFVEEFYDADYAAEGTLSNVIVDEDMISNTVEEYETYSYLRSPQGVIDMARLSSTLMTYTIYHATSTNYDIMAEDGKNYNSTLHGLLNDWSVFGSEPDIKEDLVLEEDGVTLVFCPMPNNIPALSKGYGNLITDSINGDKGFKSIMAILQAQSYVFESLAKSEFGISNGYDPQTLSEILEDPYKATEAKYNNLGTVIDFLQQCHNGSAWDATMAAEATLGEMEASNIWIFRCIIELYDTCQLLEIDPSQDMWSPTIKAYYELYTEYSEAFEAMRSSDLLYGRGYTGGATVDNPLGVFYSVQGKEMSDKWNIGFANSALYVPMVTNLYDAGIYEFANTKDKDWISEFMYRYGFHRKALYISTDPNVVVNNKMNKSSNNGMVVATLKDLLNYERDIQLYIDTNFYNAQHIENAIGKVDYATLYQYTHDKDITYNVTDQAALENMQDEANNAEKTLYNEDANNFIDETLNIDTKTLLKDDDIVSYSPDIAKNVTHLGETAEDSESLYDGYVLSSEALTGKDNVFNLYNYTPITSYAIVSAIYRDIDIYNELATVSKKSRVVFESSKNILYTDGTTNKDWISYMNYIQLSNLENQMNKNVETQLDLESPIFIDIFGNIVTESGFVIIPSASNATLCEDTWTPYTIAFGTYMSAGGNEVLAQDLPKDVFEWLTAQSIEEFNGDDAVEGEEETPEVLTLDSMGEGTKGGWFVYTRDGKIQLKNVYLESWGLSALVNWSIINMNSDVIQEVFWNNAYFNKAIRMYNNRTINMVTEVLRGAPIENIDYVEEGISDTRSGEAGIVIAYALDELLNTLSSEDSDFVNSMTTMPNIALMDNLKYVIYFGIKIILALSILVFVIYLFRSGVKNRLGFKEVFKLALTVIIVVSAIWILPNSITWSYDSANSNLLSEEAEEMLLYSSMREAEGQQIGITEVSKIDEQTQLLVKVDEVNPSWAKILGTALLSNEYDSFTDLFDESLAETPYYDMAGVVQKGSDVYIDIQTIMDSTSISYSKSSNTLYNKNVIRDEQQYYSQKAQYAQSDIIDEATGEVLHEKGDYLGYIEGSTSTGNSNVDNPTESGDGYIKQDYYAIYSFTSPYYVILDSLIANINEYNQTHNIQTYTATIDSKGRVMTYDVATPYLTSDEFLVEGYDILGLTDALMLETQLPKFAYIFDEEDKANIKESAWYPAEPDEEYIMSNINDLYNYARSFIIDHKEVLRHIPDEMLVKVLAFACSIEYNKLFSCEYGNSIALISVDNRDIMRFMLSDFKGVYSNVAYSFGRYVYQTSGTIGVVLSAILLVVILITTVLKPVLIWVLFIIIIINVIFRQMLFNKPNQGVEGYFTGCALFMAMNYLYAALLKVCFILADSNLSAISAMILCIVIQVAYLLAMCWMLYVQVKDWRDGGWNKFGPAVVAIGDYGRRFVNRGYRQSRGYQPYPYDRRDYDYSYDRRRRRRDIDELISGPSDEPQAVYMDERGRRGRRNRATYNGPYSLDEMRQRDAERESSITRRY